MCVPLRESWRRTKWKCEYDQTIRKSDDQIIEMPFFELLPSLLRQCASRMQTDLWSSVKKKTSRWTAFGAIGKACSLLVFMVIAGTSMAQSPDSAEVKFWVQPYNQVEYILDGVERLKQVEYPAARFTEGDHRLIFWAPHCSILDTTLHVVGGVDMALRKVLKQTPEYLAYKREQSHVWLKKAAWRGLPLLFTVGFGIKSFSDKNAHDQAYDDLHALRDSYSTMVLPSAIEMAKTKTIPAAQEELDATRRQLTMSLALCGVGAVATVYGFIRAGKLSYPEYEDKERIRFDGMAWIPTAQGGMYLAQLSIPLR